MRKMIVRIRADVGFLTLTVSIAVNQAYPLFITSHEYSGYSIGTMST